MLEIDNMIQVDLGFHHIFHQWVFYLGLRMPQTKAVNPNFVKESRGEKFLLLLEYHKVEEYYTLVGSKTVVTLTVTH
jgi:hypothetical protein